MRVQKHTAATCLRILLISLVLCITVLFLGGCTPTAPTPDPDPTPAVNEVIISIVGEDGEEISVDLAALEQISSEGSLIRSTGTINGPALLSGPSLDAVLAPVGGLNRGQALRVTADDGYSMIFSYEQAQGHLMTYDGEGNALVVGDTIPIIAIASQGPELAEGLPRLAFVGEDAPLTDGHFWIRGIAQLSITQDVSEWYLDLFGVSEYSMDRSTFESLATCPDTPHPAQRWETQDKEGNTLVYDGVPLWVLISTVDGAEDLAPHYRFNRALAREGYTVQVIAADGYTVEFESMDVAYNDDIFLAYMVNDELLDAASGPLMLTGPGLTTGAQRVRQVAEIRLVNLPE